MARPPGGYRLSNGERCVGVTTVTSRFKDSGALIAWAHRMGLEGKDFRAERDRAADAGTLAHAMIEAEISGGLPMECIVDQPDEIAGFAVQGFEAYLRWAKQSSVEILSHERSIVSESQQFGGTYDAVASVDGRLALLDFKTGGVYPEHLAQIGGYIYLIEEADGVKIEEIHLLKLNKEDASFTHYSWVRFDEAVKAFLLMRELYDLDRVLRRKVK